MKKELEEMWDEAAKTGEPIDIGGIVVCDFCDEDYTDRDDSGGFIFTSNACCPACEDRMMATIIKYNEEGYIRARCPEHMSFAEFIRKYREGAGGNTIQVTISKEKP